MRSLGVLLFVVGGVATAYCTAAAFTRRRPADVAFALLAPIAVSVALVGLLVAFVPAFL